MVGRGRMVHTCKGDCHALLVLPLDPKRTANAFKFRIYSESILNLEEAGWNW